MRRRFLVPALAWMALAPRPAAAGMVPNVPGPCDGVPLPDTLNGSAGSAPCYTPHDAARPTVIQAANVVTTASGAWTVVWARPFASEAPVVTPLAVGAGSLPIVCNVMTRSAKTATGKCWQATAITLGGTVAAVLGFVVNTFSAPAANVPVMLAAREPTQ